MAILLFLLSLLLLLYLLTALTFTFQTYSVSPPSPERIDEECRRSFIRDNWIFGSVVSNKCPALRNDYLVSSNLLYRRDVVSEDTCCSFSINSTLVPIPRILVADTIREFNTFQLNEKPYLVNFTNRSFTPICRPCSTITSVVLENIEGSRYAVETDAFIEVDIDIDSPSFRPIRVAKRVDGTRFIEAEIRDGKLVPIIDERFVTPVTFKIIEIENQNRRFYFQPLPLP